MFPTMQSSEERRCPKCGGHKIKDLGPMRRITGGVLMAGAAISSALLATASTPVPGWAIAISGGGFILGVIALLGASSAKYCPECNLRMAAPAKK